MELLEFCARDMNFRRKNIQETAKKILQGVSIKLLGMSYRQSFRRVKSKKSNDGKHDDCEPFSAFLE